MALQATKCSSLAKGPTVFSFSDIKTFLPIEAKSKFPALKRKCHNFRQKLHKQPCFFYHIYKDDKLSKAFELQEGPTALLWHFLHMFGIWPKVQ